MSEQKAVTILELIEKALSANGLRPRLLGRFARIPAFWRDGDDNNISVNLESGKWTDFVTGESGKPFSELIQLMGVDITNVSSIRKTNRANLSLKGLQRKYADNNLWDKGTPLNDDSKEHVKIALKYFENRGIPVDAIKGVLKGMRAIKDGELGAILLLPIYSPLGAHERIGMQRIFLDKNGKKEARNGKEEKMMLGSHFVGGDIAGGFLLAGDSQRFNKKILAVCEGPETGLAIRAATGMPVYIMYDAGGLSRVSIEFLSELGVTELLIASDNDDPNPKLKNIQVGQKASFDLAEKVCRESNEPVRISIPPREYGGEKNSDWLDVFVKNPAGMASMLFSSVEYIPEHKRINANIPVKISGVFTKRKF